MNRKLKDVWTLGEKETFSFGRKLLVHSNIEVANKEVKSGQIISWAISQK